MTEHVQLALLLLTSALFGVAFVLGYRRMRQAAQLAEQDAGAGGAAGLAHEASIGPAARVAVAAAVAVGAGLLVWRAVARSTWALPGSDPFDAFLLLGMLLALVVVYFRWTRHLRSLSFFLLPMIVVLLLIGAGLAVVSHANGQRQDLGAFWTQLHVVTIVAGMLCFVLGCVGGLVYLLADRQLRGRGLDHSHRWIGLPPLASMEKFNLWMVYLGFPLLTIATIAGILRVAQNPALANGPGGGPGIGMHVKVALGSLSWLVYAVLAHVPLNPRFRGRRAAWLSIIGFVLFMVTYIVSSWN